MTQENVLRQQLDYYRARAHECDASLESITSAPDAGDQPEQREWGDAIEALHGLGRCDQVLELAGGTGIWTRELLPLASDLTVLDGSPEMLAINRAKIHDPHVRYEIADLFSWEPGQAYDLVFFAFWLSHVPPGMLDRFLDRVQHAVRPGGRVFIVDEPAGGHQLSGTSDAGMLQRRTIQDGREFSIVKVYYGPAAIQEMLNRRGFIGEGLMRGEYFFWLASRRGEAR